MASRTQAEIEEMETATDLCRDEHAPNCDGKHRFIGTCPVNSDPKCAACGFLYHSHGKYSEICPVLVRGMLSMFRVEASDAKR